MTDPDWNAEVYHQVSEPQLRWGREVLLELALDGSETVIDAGCGSGRLTRELLGRLPRGRVIALDASAAMLEKARAELHDPRVSFLQADLGRLELDAVADVVFSNATFHWVLDHDALFRGLFRALLPNGRLHAQCGGAGNLEHHLAIARRCMPAAADHRYPTVFASAEASAHRLTAAGFVAVSAWLKPAPARFPDANRFRTFIEHVTLRTVVASLGPTAARFLDQVTEASAPDYTLDYVRLELRAVHP